MKKLFILELIFLSIIFNNVAFAATAGITQIQSFLQNVIQTMAALAGLVAAVFFVIGGFHYITSSGNPLALEKAKKTIIYSAFGLVIVLAAFVLSNVVNDLGTQAFGK